VKTLGMNARRLLHIARVLAAHGAAYLVVRGLGWWPWLVRRAPLTRLTPPQRFRRLFEDLGGSFIKFGQMLALQPDIVSREYCDELFDLLDRIEPFPFAHVEQVFREELGRTPQEIFDWFDPEPLATASIGQVHVAFLGGQKVAVKVQRPLVDVEFAGDIRLIQLAIRLIRRLGLKSLFWTLGPMSEFAAWTLEELDYRREARYADKLRRNARDNPFERVPSIFWHVTTRRTLVMEYMTGVTALDYLRAVTAGGVPAARSICPSGFEPDRFARHIIDNFLGDAFRYGVFHADLHPANLLMLPGEAVAYVDFGITGVLSRYSRRHLVAMTLAYASADVEALTDAFFKVTVMDAESNPGLFRTRLAHISREWYHGEGTETVFLTNFTRVMLDMLVLCREARLSPERDVVKYIRSAVAADGLITRLAPGFDVGRYLEEECQRLVASEVRRATLSEDTLSAVLSSTVRLVGDGTARMTTIVRRLAEGDMTAQVEVSTAVDQDARHRRRTLRLAGVVVALTALVELTGGARRIGVNMFTIEAALAGVALVLLVASVRRLVGSH
jgi:ubiquinone biosynthesis protein